ncbi:hypothetical protein OF83DRAFT_1163659 [Amylostereum chailletii]|nr:hypothetical protein OF83DRAFT_1163659 [Amylostereum chailletii]
MGPGGAPGMGGMASMPMTVNIGQGGLMSGGSGNANMLPGSGGGLMGPPHVVPSRGPSQTPGPDMSMGMGGMTPGGDARMRQGQGQNMNMGMYEQAISPVQPKLNPAAAMAAMREREMHLQAMGGLGGIPNAADPMAMSGVGGGMPLNVGMAGVDGPVSAPPSAVAPRLPNNAIPPSLPPPASAPPVAPSASASTSASLPVPVKRPHSGSTDLKEATTRITYVGPDDITPLTDEEMADVNAWRARDKAYDAMFRGMHARMDQERAAIGPKAAGWWEEADPTKPRARFSITYPGHRVRENKKKGRREGFKLPRTRKHEQPEDPEVLVPIRLEFEVDHNRMRDTFVWNLNDAVVTPEIFAQSIVDDYALTPSYVNVIAKAIQDQLSDYKAHSMDDVHQEPMQGKLEGEEKQWWEGWRKRLWVDGSRRRKRRRLAVESDAETDVSMMPFGVNDVEVNDDDAPEEMRILIKLDITVGSMKLDDQFEWDMENPGASPEQFAEIYARDLGLGGEFKTAIAHCIREQVQTYQKSLFLVGHPSDGTMVQDDDLRMSFLPSLSSAARSMDQVQSFTPILNYLSDSELERNEKEREKELARRKKRNTRGRRGVALPDREPTKTCRTPAIGFPEADPAVLALAQAAAAPAGRRAAAAAASLTIANMVASENGTAVIAPSAPVATPSAASAPKEKKPKGLFKAPPVPPSVLHARARVTAPTPSTAVDASTLPPPLENDPPLPMAATPPDSRAMRTISAKRAKELEREAKEKEFVDGQHANMINGVWHCSNCGCPEDIAIGRRKGPLGDKSQCGTCGKFWHRHRRPRPVEYNSDPQFHLKQRADADKSKSSSKRKRGGQAVDEASTPAPIPEPETPSKRSDVETTRAPASRRAGGEERAISPVSSSSSASEPPLAQKIKLNGASASRATSTVPPPPPPPPPQETTVLNGNGNGEDVGMDSGPRMMTEDGQGTDDLPPDWLVESTAAAQRDHPDDRFEIIARDGPTGMREWRIKCVDCPGKLYKPNLKTGELGLSNFVVHLLNRLHRNRVNARVTASGGIPANQSFQ